MRQQLFIVIVSVVTLICPVISAAQTQYNHYTIYGVQCTHSCAKQGQTYYWCKNPVSFMGWDYCSPTENTDYYGNPCQQDHPCGKYGEDYYWCTHDGGSWEKCGPVEPKSTIYNTKYLSVCIDDCIYDDYYKYSWCHTENHWDYCSETHDVTVKNEPCKSGHRCDTYGYNYSWCKTESSWDYCGVIKPGECYFFDTQRRKKQSNNDNNNRIGFCGHVDRRNIRVITFSATPDNRSIAEVTNRNRIVELNQLITIWDNGYLTMDNGQWTMDTGNQTRSNLTELTNYRFHLQGMEIIDNQRYCNVQIQENIHRNNRESTTVSQILVPQQSIRQGLIPERFIRRAFKESRKRRARIFLKIEHLNNTYILRHKIVQK